MIEQILAKIGLTQNEIKVYLALLALGESKTGEILKKSELNSGKIYEILDSLMKKGLVSFAEKDNIKRFSPADPKRVLDYLEEKKKDIENQEKEYHNILPDLLKKAEFSKPESKIEIFTGIKGMKTAYNKELKFPSSNTLYVLGVTSSKQYTKKVWNFFINNHQPKREKSGYKIRKLLNIESKKEKRFHEKNAEIKYLPYGTFVSINAIGNLVTIGIFSEEPICISIEDKKVATSFKEQFKLLWKIAKK